MQESFEQIVTKSVVGQGDKALSQYLTALGALMAQTGGRSDLVRVVIRRVVAVGREMDRRGVKLDLAQAVTQ